MIVLDEKPWHFEFDDETPFWKWVLYADNNKDFLKVKNVVKGTKSTDFLGIYLGNDLNESFLLEIKYYADENFLPDTDQEILSDLAQKVRDSLACLIAGSRNSTHFSAQYSEWIVASQNSNARLYVAFFVDFPKAWTQNKIKATQGIFLRSLKQKLNWVTGNIILMDHTNYANFFQGLKVSKI
jgi:hypothetical protein